MRQMQSLPLRHALYYTIPPGESRISGQIRQKMYNFVNKCDTQSLLFWHL